MNTVNGIANARRKVRFGVFEYSTATGELWRRGHTVKLVGQPVHLLNLLIERPGEVVTREEMRSRLWPDGTFVDFEHSLNAAIKRLRRALGDSATKPRFIETMARQGYRFIAPVETLEAEMTTTGVEPLERQTLLPPALPEARPSGTRLALALLVAAVAGAAMILAVDFLTGRTHPVLPRASNLTLLLAGEGDLSAPAISSDGKTLAYVKGTGGSERIYLRRVAGGNPIRLTREEARESEPAFAPDDERIAFTRYPPGSTQPQICVAPVLGGEIAFIVAGGRDPAWSPDGLRLAFVLEQPNGVQAMATSRSDGTELRIILRADGSYPFLHHPSWSADSRSIAVERGVGGSESEVWVVPADGGKASRLGNAAPTVFRRNPVFTPDGKGMLYSSNRAGATDLWYCSIGKHPHTVQLTQGPSPEDWPSVSHTGKVIFLTVNSRDVLFLARPATQSILRLLSHSPLLWAPCISPDGSEVVFSQGEYNGMWSLWTVPVAGGYPRQLTSGQAPQIYGRFSRDGRWLIYFTLVEGRSRIWRVPRHGGAAQPLTPANQDAAYGDLSPDGHTLAFAQTENGATHIYLKLVADGAERELTHLSSTVPRWSPDGKWIAFSPRRDLKSGVFIAHPDGSSMRRVTASGGWPQWLPAGKGLAFRTLSPDGTQQIETVTLDRSVVAPLGKIKFSGDNDLFDLSPDGKLIAYTNGETFSSEIWILDLRQ
jgi:Tol biopolymer transport system component/DNA-binding winged helix-turn-helix (wHTH) protein